jgi:integrase
MIFQHNELVLLSHHPNLCRTDLNFRFPFAALASSCFSNRAPGRIGGLPHATHSNYWRRGFIESSEHQSSVSRPHWMRVLAMEVMHEKMYAYNHAEGRSEVQPFMDRKAKQSWGNPRRRLLVHAVLTVAFVCLLRIDEALNLRFEDIIFHSPQKIDSFIQKENSSMWRFVSHFYHSDLISNSFRNEAISDLDVQTSR